MPDFQRRLICTRSKKLLEVESTIHIDPLVAHSETRRVLAWITESNGKLVAAFPAVNFPEKKAETIASGIPLGWNTEVSIVAVLQAHARGELVGKIQFFGNEDELHSLLSE